MRPPAGIPHYLPFKFTHQGAPWSRSTADLSGTTWGEAEEYAAIEKDFARVQEWAEANKRPILLGEVWSGTTSRGFERDSVAASRPRKMRFRQNRLTDRATETWHRWRIRFSIGIGRLARLGRQQFFLWTVLAPVFLNPPGAEALTPDGLKNEGNSSPFVLNSWLVEDGLPHNSVNAILQSSDGYLWLATSDGLARFDGVSFTKFGLQHGLASLRVLALLEDHDGSLWIGTSMGLSRMRNGQLDTWTTRDGLAGNEISSLAQGRSGAIWVGTITGLSRWSNGKFTTLGKPEGLEDKRVRAVAADSQGEIWVSMFYQGLLEWDGAKFTPVARPPELSPAPPLCLMQDRKGNLWAGLARGIVQCREQGQWRQYGNQDGLRPNNVLQLAERSDGVIWAALGNAGLYHFAGGCRDPGWRPALLENDAAISLLADREGTIWAGLRTRGLVRLKPKKVTVLRIQEGEGEALPRTLAETPDGSLWVGTSSRGLFRVRNGETDLFLREPPVLGYPYVSAVITTRDGSLWWGAGPALFQWKQGQLRSAYTTEYRSWLREDRIRVLCEDREDGLWIGTQNGQLRLLREGKFINFTNSQPAAPITALLQQADGTLLVGTYGKGLLRIRDGTRLTPPTVEPSENTFILALHLDSAGVLWMGTEGAGLFRLEAGRLTRVSSRNGLISDTIVQIVEDDTGHLWLGSYRGILRLSKQELKNLAEGTAAFVHPLILNRSEGIPSELCMRGFNAGLKTRNGLLHFSTDRGIVIVNPNHLWTNATSPAVWLESMAVDGSVRHLRIQSGLRGGQATVPESGTPLRVPPGKRRFEFHYTGLSLSDPENVRFRYQLEGLDDQWFEVGRERMAFYSLLPAGSYRFRVTACGNSGIWNEEGASLSFVVEPFFWQTWLFRLPLLIGLLAAVVAAVRYLSFRRFRSRLKSLEQEAAVQKDRARIAKDLHDDLGAHLSQVAALSELAQTDIDKPIQAREHLDLIFRTARSATRSLDEIVWAVNPRNDTLDRFTAHLCTFAPEFLRAAGIRCRLDVPLDLPSTPLPANVRHHLYLALKETLHNVVKHSGASEVWLRLTLCGRELTLIIEDNGRGFQPGRCPTQGEDGLANLRQRMTEIGGRFDQHSEPDGGTRTTLAAPLPPDAP